MSYFSLASLIGKDRQKANFRRFNKLTMLNLLRLQYKIRSSEEVIEETLDGGKDFYTLEHLKEPRDQLAWMHIKSLEDKLGKYHTLLLQAAEVNKLPYAPRRGIHDLQNWLYGEHFGRSFLGANELNLWNATNDIVTIYPQGGVVERGPSFLSKALFVISQFRTRKNPRVDEETGVQILPVNNLVINRIGFVIATILSSALPILAIIVLYFVKETINRLAIAVGFTSLFAVALTAFTSARTIEIFSATAGFAAVEVVFIGGVSS